MLKLLLSLFLVLSFFGCASTKYTYRQIEDDKDQFTSHAFQCSISDLHKAVTEVLLMKKFTIYYEDAVNGTLTGSRYFTHGYQKIVVVIQSKIISKNDKEQRLFLNGIQTTERNYVADRTRFLLWIIPLPGGGGKEVTESKESEFVISDKPFYDDLFNDIQKVLNTN